MMVQRLYVTTVRFRKTLSLNRWFSHPATIALGVLCLLMGVVCFEETRLLLQAQETVSLLRERSALQNQILALESLTHAEEAQDCRKERYAYREVLRRLLSRLGLDKSLARDPDPFMLFLANADQGATFVGGPPVPEK